MRHNSKRNLEADAEAQSAVSRNHGLAAARRRGNIPGQRKDMLWSCFEKAFDVAAAGKMLVDPLAQERSSKSNPP
jgi:hypothetical protein